LDAGNSGEDVSLNSFVAAYDVIPVTRPSDLTSCKLYDGSAVLTTGSNIKSPTAIASSTTFTFDAPLIITKGTSKTIALKCDVAGNATADDKFAWGYDSDQDLSSVGKTSGQDIVETVTDSVGQYMTIATGGAYTVVDDSSPGYTVVSAGTTGVTLLKLKFSATTEDMDITRVAFQLADGARLDLVNSRINLYDDATLVGTADFATGNYATSTSIATGAFRVPSGSSKTMIVKGDIAAISGTVGPLKASGDLLKVAWDANDVNATTPSSGGNYGKGVSSGASIVTSSASDITPTGARIFKAYPTFAKIDLSSSERILQSVSGAVLYKFSVKANAGDAYLYKFTFKVSSSTGTNANAALTDATAKVYAYTDSGYSLADTAFTTDGTLNYGGRNNEAGGTSILQDGPKLFEMYFSKTSLTTGTTTYKVPSGETRWFVLKADITGVETQTGSEYLTVQLEGDAVAPTDAIMQQAAIADADSGAHEDFIWSPNSTTTSNSLVDYDFTNGYGLTGLPTTNMPSETLTSAN